MKKLIASILMLLSINVFSNIEKDIKKLFESRENIVQSKQLLEYLDSIYKEDQSLDLLMSYADHCIFHGKHHVKDTRKKRKFLIKALKLSKKAYKKYKDSESKFLYAIALVEIGSIKESLKILEKAKNLLLEMTDKKPKKYQAEIHATLGSLFHYVPGWPTGFGSNSKAEKHFKKSIKINPKLKETYYHYAKFLWKNGSKKEAVNIVEKAISLPIDKKNLLDEKLSIKNLKLLKHNFKKNI